MPSTLVHGLLPPSCLMIARKQMPKMSTREWFYLWCVAAFLANSPDLDIIPASLFPSHFSDIHRNWGHNLFSFCILSYAGMVLIRRISPLFSKKRAALISASLVASHLALDATNYLSSGMFAGVPLFWPISPREFCIRVPLFPAILADKTNHPLWGLITSKPYWTSGIVAEILGSLLVFSVWVVLFHTSLFIKRKLKCRSIMLMTRKKAAQP